MARNWTDEELYAAMYLYCMTPFGRLHKGNPDIVALAERMDRTPSSLAMKLVNLASLDRVHQDRGVIGLRGASRRDREVWERFANNWTTMAVESTRAFERYMGVEVLEDPLEAPIASDVVQPYSVPTGPTSALRQVSVRIGQRFFRKMLDISYEGRCCVSGCDVPSLLVASHIVRWADDVSLRLNPQNGLLLSAIHDRAFEGGLFTIDDDMKLDVSPAIRSSKNDFLRQSIGRYHGERLRLPSRFAPRTEFLRRHRERFAG